MLMDQELIIIVSVLSGAWLFLLLLVVVILSQLFRLRRVVREMQATGRIRVQKLKMDRDQNHAFHNQALSPEEELSRRGYSMYQASEHDVESARPSERQTGGQFVDELQRELDSRQQRQAAPPFLLQSIEDNKRKSRNLANGRQSDTNPNFIY